jgi:hypothetical protein
MGVLTIEVMTQLLRLRPRPSTVDQSGHFGRVGLVVRVSHRERQTRPSGAYSVLSGHEAHSNLAGNDPAKVICLSFKPCTTAQNYMRFAWSLR